MQFQSTNQTVWKKRLLKTVNVGAQLAIIINLSYLGVIFTPSAQAAELPVEPTVEKDALLVEEAAPAERDLNIAPSASLQIATDGAVCPAGDVKFNIDGGYEYTDNSATVTGNGTQINWSVALGYDVVSVCVKIGGQGGGELIYPEPTDNGTAGPYDHDISHVVITTSTDQVCSVPVDVMLVIDRSGSMAGTPMADAKTAAKSFVNLMQLDDSQAIYDQVGLSSYATTGSLNEGLTTNGTTVKNDIDGLNATGFTNIERGTVIAQGELGTNGRGGDVVPVMIVLTDGVANRYGAGPTSCDTEPTSHTDCTNAAIGAAGTAKAAGTTIFTIGLGIDDFGDQTEAVARDTLQQMASGAGYFFETPNSSELKSIYQQIATTICNFGSIAGHKYEDVNKNGTYEQGVDQPIEGWDITLNGTTTVATDADGMYQFGGLVAGDYTVTEEDRAGWMATTPAEIDITLAEGEHATGIDFLNKQIFCDLTIVKSVNKQSAVPGEVLTYTVTVANEGDANCTGGGVKIQDTLDDDITYVNGSETHQPGTDFGYNGAPGFQNGTLTWNANVLEPQESSTVTFRATVRAYDACTEDTIPNYAKAWSDETGWIESNTVWTSVTTLCQGELKVKKNVDTDGDGDIDLTNTATWTWDISGGEQNIATGQGRTLPANTQYTISEDQKADYHVVDLTCNGQSYGAVESAQVYLTTAGLTCTFTNTRNTGGLTVIKAVDTDGDGDIDITNDPTWTWDLDGGNQNFTMGTTQTVTVGQHQVTEDNKAGYHNISWVCVNSQTQATLGNGTGTSLTVNVPTNGATCTFTNARDTGSISGNKFNDLDGDGIWDGGEPGLQGWTIQLSTGASTLTDANGHYAFNLVQTGTYTINEMQQSDWVSTTPNPVTNVAVVYNQTTNVNFGNFDEFDIRVCKKVDANGDGDVSQDPFYTTGWNVMLNQVQKTTGQDGCTTYADLGPGSYTVAEAQKAGWQQTYPVAGTYALNGQSGQDREYVFGNSQLPVTLSVTKIVCTDESDLPNWGDHRDDADNEPAPIDADTAADWIATHESCSLQPDWSFQWAPGDTAKPADNAGELGAPWTTFGVTDGSGVVTAEIDPIDSTHVWVREVFQNGYLPFSNNAGWQADGSDYSAEIYCGWDIWNYDNYDYADMQTPDETRYCVAWNKPVDFDVTLEKTGPAMAEPGDEITYTLKWEITGDASVESLVLTDPLPAHTVFVTASDGGSGISGVVTWTFIDGPYQAGDTGSVTITVKLADVLYDGTQIENKAQVCGFAKDISEEELVKHCDDDTTTTAVESDFTVQMDKTGQQTAEVGAQVTYTLTYLVTGNTPVDNLVITDVVPVNTTFVSASGSYTYDNVTKTVTWDLGSAMPGDTGSVTMTVTINDVAGGTIISNTGEICGEVVQAPSIVEEEAIVHCDDDTTTTRVIEPVLKLDKVVLNEPIFYNPGNTVNYQVTITNTGDAAAKNLVLTDTLPAGMTFTGTILSTKTFTIGDLAAGASTVVTYNVVIGTSVIAGFYDNLAKLTATNHDPLQDIERIEVRVPLVLATVPKLVIEKTANTGFVNPGDTVTYTVVVKNTGDGTAIDVVLKDALPDGFTFKDTGTKTKLWTLGNIEPNQSVTVTYDILVPKDLVAGFYDNLAIVSADNHGPVTDTIAVEVRPVQVLAETGIGLVDYILFGLGALMLAAGIWIARKEDTERSLS